jgi:hypothetical protein
LQRRKQSDKEIAKGRTRGQTVAWVPRRVSQTVAFGVDSTWVATLGSDEEWKGEKKDETGVGAHVGKGRKGREGTAK